MVWVVHVGDEGGVGAGGKAGGGGVRPGVDFGRGGGVEGLAIGGELDAVVELGGG